MSINPSIARNRVARYLSNGQTGEEWDSKVGIMSDYGAVGSNLNDLAAVDSREIATGDDHYFYRHRSYVGMAPEWIESAWAMGAMSTTFVEMYQDFSYVKDEPVVELTSGLPPFWPIDVNLRTGNVQTYILNEVEARIFEKTLETSADYPDYEDLIYGQVTYQEIMDGSLGEMFDVIRLGVHQFVNCTETIIDKLFDCLKPGGLFMGRGMAHGTGMYLDDLTVHQSFWADQSRYIASKENVYSRHVAFQNGLVIARKLPTN